MLFIEQALKAFTVQTTAGISGEQHAALVSLYSSKYCDAQTKMTIVTNLLTHKAAVDGQSKCWR
jgi:hypothetical protein